MKSIRSLSARQQAFVFAFFFGSIGVVLRHLYPYAWLARLSEPWLDPQAPLTDLPWNSPSLVVVTFLHGMLWGSALGVLQWAVLRVWIPCSFLWVLLTALGHGLSRESWMVNNIVNYLMPGFGGVFQAVLPNAVGNLIAPLLQCLLIRRTVPGAFWYFLVSAICIFASVLFEWVVYIFLGAPEFIWALMTAVQYIFHSYVPAAALAFLVVRSQQTAASSTGLPPILPG